MKIQLMKSKSEKGYELAEHRGFTPGHELDDWLEAKKQVTAKRRQEWAENHCHHVVAEE